MKPQVAKSPPMAFRISIPLVKRMRAAAKKTKTTITAIVEAALTKYLAA